MKWFCSALYLTAFYAGIVYGQDTKIAIAMAPVVGKAEAETISQIMQAELSQSATLTLVEREQIDKALREMKMDAQGMLNPNTSQKLGAIIGARYFCHSSINSTGNKSLAIVKVVDVKTTLTKLAYSQVQSQDDVIEAGKALAIQVEKLVAQFEKERTVQDMEAPKTNANIIPDHWKRPTVMVIIPEMHVRQMQLIDPAGETEIVKRLLADKFRVIDSEYVLMMKRGQETVERFRTLKTCTQYAASKKADILIYGEAISERGASVGEFTGCRGRIELKAINVKTDEILVSDSAEGGASDIAETVAGKRAIQQAANRLADTFLYSVAEKWNAK